ncbi:hypothetical protein QQF64_008101, partial [Cirrhinus molitorella]
EDVSFKMDGVCNAETDETISVMEGDSVILNTNLSEILNDDTILWTFGPKGSVISQITRKNDLTVTTFTDDVRFTGRLQVDQTTGSLNIRNTRNSHSGQYKLTISRDKTTYRIFHVDVFGVVGETDGVKSVSVKEGETIILLNDATELQKDDLIVWRFGDKGILLGKMDVETNKISLNEADERFRNRLQLDQAGSLIISNARPEHSGLYEVQIRGRGSLQQFLVSVSADWGQSSTVIAVIVVAVLLVAGLLAAVIYFGQRISELQKQLTEEEKVSEAEGRTVALRTGTELQNGDEIKWWFGDDNNPLTQKSEWVITDKDKECDVTDERFRSKLQMSGRTGDLIISDIRAIHSGVYKVQISGKTRTTKIKRFIITVNAEEEKVSEMEGRTVALRTGIELQNGDEIKWWFGDDNNPLTEKSEWAITDKDIECEVTDERFRNKLLMGHKYGDLIISYIRTIHSGVYKVQIRSKTRTTKIKRFIVTVNVQEVQVKVGEHVTLNSDIEIQGGDVILWTFGVKNCLILKEESGPTSICESFRGRLQLNKQNGSLTITNFTKEDFGHFQLQVINGERNRFRRFNVIE